MDVVTFTVVVAPGTSYAATNLANAQIFSTYKGPL